MNEPTTTCNSLTIHSKFQRNSNSSAKSDNIVVDEDKSARKFFTTWKSACDKTKDKTRELLKRTLSWKGQDYSISETRESHEEQKTNSNRGWKVHIWTTWVKRSSMNDDMDNATPISLSAIQKEKFSHFFYHLLDFDRDDLISIDDFNQLSEKLRHFADWSSTSIEFSLLKQVQQEMVKTFFTSVEVSEYSVHGYIQLDDWLKTWSNLLKNVRKFNELPFWLQQLPKVLFLIINKSGSGVLTKSELKTFFISVIDLRDTNDKDIAEMYKSMTSNNDFKLIYTIYELCFTNWLLCQNPNGPGQWLFGKCGNRFDSFPIDYSALNTSPEDRETYTPDKKSNRHSVII